MERGGEESPRQAETEQLKAHTDTHTREHREYVHVVPWSAFPIVPSYPHYPQQDKDVRRQAASSMALGLEG